LEKELNIAILGAGPSGMFLLKRLIETGRKNFRVDIFERGDKLGSGMPYSRQGAGDEHVTNVSANEIPQLVHPVAEWLNTVNADTLSRFNISAERFNDYKVLPRLLFGNYLSDQFSAIIKQGLDLGIKINIRLNSMVTDIADQPDADQVVVHTNKGKAYSYDRVVVCTGHHWPAGSQHDTPGYYDAPYPPHRIRQKVNHEVGILGASLTAIDAVRTLARENGEFYRDSDQQLAYRRDSFCPNFKIVMHSRGGMLPAIRFHLDDSTLSSQGMLSKAELAAIRESNDGFLPLDEIFKRSFLEPLQKRDPEFYNEISNLNLEAFVAKMMSLREELDPFVLFRAEYTQAQKSINRKQSIHWKELLAVLSFSMNYPAKYFSAEDMLRLKEVLMPLISLVIAFVPQVSAEELLALNAAGVLELIAVSSDSVVIPSDKGGADIIIDGATKHEGKIHYPLFIDCRGQPQLSFDQLPYPSLIEQGTASPASLRFNNAARAAALMDAGDHPIGKDENGRYHLRVSGIAINDHFQLVDSYGGHNQRIYMMAVPFIGGYNPDYSGLDFCEEASGRITEKIFN